MTATTTVAPELKRVFEKLREASDRWADACDEAIGLAREGDGTPEEVAEAMVRLEPPQSLKDLRRAWARATLRDTTWTIPEGFDAAVCYSFDDEATCFATGLHIGPVQILEEAICLIDEDLAQSLRDDSPTLLVDLLLKIFEPAQLGAPSEPDELRAWREALDAEGLAALVNSLHEAPPRAEVALVVTTTLTTLLDAGYDTMDLPEGYIEDLRAGL